MTTNNGPDGLRAVWLGQATTSFSMEPPEIQRKFSRLQTRLRRRKYLAYVICLSEAIWFAYWLIFANLAIVMRIGCLLIILGVNFLAGQVWLDDRERQKALENASAAGQVDCTEFYRTELVRQRDHHRGVWLWSRLISLLPGLLLIGTWSAIRDHGRKGGDAGEFILIATPILAAVAIWLNHRTSQRHQRQIDAIDAMKRATGSELAEKPVG